jgi:hypothetical protein
VGGSHGGVGRTRLEGSRANADAGKGVRYPGVAYCKRRGSTSQSGLIESACVLRDAGTRGDRIGRQGPNCFTCLVQSRWMR